MQAGAEKRVGGPRKTGAPRIAIVHASRPLGTVTAATVDALRNGGAEVDVLTVGGSVDVATVGTGHNLYVLKHSYDATLTFAAMLHAARAPTLNPYPAVAACRDKAVAFRILADADLPVPRTHLVVDPPSATPLLDGGPLMIKPNTGSKGRGVRVVRTVSELAAVDPVDGPYLAQRFHSADGLDHKLYRIGDDVFDVRRPWPATTVADKQGVAVEVDDRLRRLTLDVGDAMGMDVYGVDVVVSDGQPYIVDLSAFPGFKGVPAADALLARHILHATSAVGS